MSEGMTTMRLFWLGLVLCGFAGCQSDFEDLAGDLITVAPRLPTRDPSHEMRTTRQVPSMSFFPSTASQCTFGRGKDLSAFKCEWQMDTARLSGAPKWQLSSGKSAYFNGGPPADASGDQDGGYALVETSQTAAGGVNMAVMVSDVINVTEPEGRCIVFQYSIDGPSAEMLRLMLRPVTDSSDEGAGHVNNEVLWEWRDNTNEDWRTAAVLYSYGQSHQLTFEATVEDRTPVNRRLRGFMAVDNIDLVSEDDVSVACRGHCNFDGGFCGWTNDVDDDFDWRLGRGSTNGATGPSRDHNNFASGLPSRGYAYIDSSHPRRPGDVARLSSPEMEATDADLPLCLHFWTHMFGNGIGSLRVGIKSSSPMVGVSGNQRTIWSLSGEAGNSWHRGQMTVASSTPFKIIFEGSVGRNSLGDMAIDDISLHPGPCASGPQSAATQSGDCNFELDECGWINAGTRESVDEIDWVRSVAESGRQQPTRDHSTATGKGYLMILGRGTSIQRAGDRAWLISRLFNASASQPDLRCLTFWYFLLEPIIDPAGPSLGSLRVYTRSEEENNKSLLRPIWRLQNHQAGTWQMGQALIQQTSAYRVIIEGMWGSSRGAGSIAIDDIVFFDGPCSVQPKKAKPMAAECSFDKDPCQWRNDVNNTVRPDSDWRLATPSRRPANLADHTFGASSGYVYFDVFSQGGRVETVRLVGPVVNSRGVKNGKPRMCLTFWFAAFGAGDSTELKAIRRDHMTGIEHDIWTLRVNQLDAFRPDWNFAQTEVDVAGTPESPEDFILILEGRAANGGVAVDDIILYEGSCKTRPASAAPQFKS